MNIFENHLKIETVPPPLHPVYAVDRNHTLRIQNVRPIALQVGKHMQWSGVILDP